MARKKPPEKPTPKPVKRPVQAPQSTQEQEIRLDGDRWSGFRDTFGEREVGIDPSGSAIELLRLIKEFSDVEAQLAERVERLKTCERPGVARPMNVDQDDQKRRPRLVLVSERIAGLRLSELLTRGIGQTIVPDIGAGLFVMRRLFAAAESLHAATGISHFVLAPERVVITPRAEVVIVEAALAGAIEALIAAHALPKALRLANAEGDAQQDGYRLDIARIARIGIAMMLGRPLDPGETVDALSSVLSEINDIGAIRAGDAFATTFGQWVEHAVTVDADVSFPSFREAGVALGRVDSPKDCAASRQTLRRFLVDLAIEGFSDPDLIALESDRIRAIRERQTSSRPLPPPKPWERVAREMGLPPKDQILQESPHVIAAKPKSLGNIAKQFGFVIKPEAPPVEAAPVETTPEPSAAVEYATPTEAWQSEPEVSATSDTPFEAAQIAEAAEPWQETSAPIEIPDAPNSQEPPAPVAIDDTASSWQEEPASSETAEPVSRWRMPSEFATEPEVPTTAPEIVEELEFVDMSTSLDAVLDEPGAIDLSASVAEIAEESGVIDLSTTDFSGLSTDAGFGEPEERGREVAAFHEIDPAPAHGMFSFGATPASTVEPPAFAERAAAESIVERATSVEAERIVEPAIVEPVALPDDVDAAQIEAPKKKKKSWFRFGRRDAEEAPPSPVRAEPEPPAIPTVAVPAFEPAALAPEIFETAAQVSVAPVGDSSVFPALRPPSWTPPVGKPEIPDWTPPPIAKPEPPAWTPPAPVAKPEPPTWTSRAPVATPEPPAWTPAPVAKPASPAWTPPAPIAKPQAPAWTPPAPVAKPEPPAWTPPPISSPGPPEWTPSPAIAKPESRPVIAPAPAPWTPVEHAAPAPPPVAKAIPPPVVEEEEFEDEEPAETATPEERTTWIKSVADELGLKAPSDIRAPAVDPRTDESASWQAPTPPARPAWNPSSSAVSAWQAPASPDEVPATSSEVPADSSDTSWAPPPPPPELAWQAPTSPPSAPARPAWQSPPSPSPPAPAAQRWQPPAPSAPPVPAWQPPPPSPPPAPTRHEPTAELPRTRSAVKEPSQLPQIVGAASQLIRSAALLVLAAGLIGGLAWFGRSYYQQKTTPGTVVIESNPRGADVFIDGVSKGVTPLTIELTAGDHELELRRRGGSRKLTVQIVSGQQLRQEIDLTNLRATGIIVVNSDPKGARVLLDGKALGVTPLNIPDVPAGAHKVSIEASSGTVTKDVQVAGGSTTNVNEGIFSGWIAVFAPFPLQVFEKGKLIGTTDSERIMLSAGRHGLELVNEQLGFRENRPVDVKPGDTVAVNVTSAEGTLRVTAPAGSEVFVDGARVGEAPLDELKVSVGTREVIVKHPTLGEKKVNVRVGSDKPAAVSVTFEQPQ